MKTSFNKLYQSVVEQMGVQPSQPTQQVPAQQGQTSAKPQTTDPKQLATQIAGIQDPELLTAIQQLIAAKAKTATSTQPQSTQPAQATQNAPKPA